MPGVEVVGCSVALTALGEPQISELQGPISRGVAGEGEGSMEHWAHTSGPSIAHV